MEKCCGKGGWGWKDGEERRDGEMRKKGWWRDEEGRVWLER